MRNPNVLEEMPEETLEDRLARLCEMKQEYRDKNKVFRKSTNDLLESIKSLENIITGEVLQKGRSVQIKGIKAELVTQVVFRLKKDNNGNN